MGGNVYSDWDTESSDNEETSVETEITTSDSIDNELVDPRSLPEEGE